MTLDAKIISLINDTNTIKAVATTDRNGIVHVVFKGSVSINKENYDGNIRFLELNETSQTNKNMIYSLWFKKLVSISILSADIDSERKSYQIKGIPVKAIICGKEFEKTYSMVRKHLGTDADLSAIWIIEPQEIREETASIRRQIERTDYPLVGHLDRYTGTS
jgi:hypothetical protein